MPFKSIGGGKYKSPSGRTWTKKQVVAYYATGGFKRKVKRKVKITRKSKPGRMRAVRRRRRGK